MPRMPGVDRVLGNAEKLKAESSAAGRRRRRARRRHDIMAVRETAAHLVTDFAGRARAFVQVQQGCDHRCTFCIIPFGRGPSRSVPVGAMVSRCARWSKAATREVVLTGVDITSYGADLPGAPTLGQLVRRLLALVPELPRLRLSSLDPAEIDDELWRAARREPRLMPHLHLSLQAGDDLILKRMKRRHTPGRGDRVVARAARAAARHRDRRRPDRRLPDRDRGDVRRTRCDLVEECGLAVPARVPLFSARPGTPAARMPQVPVALRRERAARLRAGGAAALGAQRVSHRRDAVQRAAGRGSAAEPRRAGRRGHCEHFARGSCASRRILARRRRRAAHGGAAPCRRRRDAGAADAGMTIRA